MTKHIDYPTGECNNPNCLFHYPGKLLGRIGRLKCLQTVVSKEPNSGLDFMIVKEKANSYLIVCTAISDLIMEVKKSHFIII